MRDEKNKRDARACTPGTQLVKAACPTAELRATGTRARSIFRPGNEQCQWAVPMGIPMDNGQCQRAMGIAKGQWAMQMDSANDQCQRAMGNGQYQRAMSNANGQCQWAYQWAMGNAKGQWAMPMGNANGHGPWAWAMGNGLWAMGNAKGQ